MYIFAVEFKLHTCMHMYVIHNYLSFLYVYYLEKDVVGHFLIYLYELQKPPPKSDWLVKRKEVRKIFAEFLNLPKNDKIRTRIGQNPGGKVCMSVLTRLTLTNEC